MIPIGYENFVRASLIVAIMNTDSAPARKIKHRAEEERMLLNATNGRKARCLIVMMSNHVILSALQPETLKSRIKNNHVKADTDREI